MKENRGPLFVKQIRRGHDINGYDLTFNQIPHALRCCRGCSLEPKIGAKSHGA
ncbi:hypothetical protein L3X07_10445 [Levilactobacillus brevis]|nr:hypothetical protein [Levilactobacillus brevis]